MSPKVLERLCHDGQLLRLTLDAPPGNVLDAEMMDGLIDALERHRPSPDLKGLLLEGAGEHFCYGASIPEHTPDRVAGMLRRFHRLVRGLFSVAVPTLASVQGRCLGGGLELAACCSFLFAAPGALFGQPEIRLGVFAPAASVLLPWRLGGGRALDLCVSGRSVGAAEALQMGLLHRIDPDPGKAAEEFFLEGLAPRSAAALRFAERAVREGFLPELEARLEAVETLYLDELMATEDAVEGIAAFLQKRPPRFRNR
jgi:cyclohexa-1,5-dienecarbonyl-CoA hydratase